MNFQMIHENYNVSDLDASIAFYREALGLHEVRRINGDGFIIVYLTNDTSDFELELTYSPMMIARVPMAHGQFIVSIDTADLGK